MQFEQYRNSQTSDYEIDNTKHVVEYSFVLLMHDLYNILGALTSTSDINIILSDLYKFISVSEESGHYVGFSVTL